MVGEGRKGRDWGEEGGEGMGGSGGGKTGERGRKEGRRQREGRKRWECESKGVRQPGVQLSQPTSSTWSMKDFVSKEIRWRARDGPMVKSIYCSSRSRVWFPSPLSGGSYSNGGNPTPLATLGTCTHTYRHTQIHATKNKITLKIKKWMVPKE